MSTDTLTPSLPAEAGALTVDTTGAARLLSISESHLFGLRRAGRFGPAPIRLGRCTRYRVDELRAWVHAGCPARARWIVMQKGVTR